jgi:hypothetical protein
MMKGERDRETERPSGEEAPIGFVPTLVTAKSA